MENNWIITAKIQISEADFNKWLASSAKFTTQAELFNCDSDDPFVNILLGGSIKAPYSSIASFFAGELSEMTLSFDRESLLLYYNHVNSTLDFAFEIHSHIGEHALYARVNGKLSSVKTVLHRGDCVEIGVNVLVKPELDWLDYVSTYKAKRFLRSYFANRKVLEYKRCSHCHPLPGDEVVGFKDNDGTITLHKRNCQLAIRLASQRGDSIVAVNFEESEDFLYPVRISIRSVDRYHLLSDLINCITDRQHLSMDKLAIETVDHIVTCTIDFKIHSVSELQAAINSLAVIDGVDEVKRIDIE